MSNIRKLINLVETMDSNKPDVGDLEVDAVVQQLEKTAQSSDPRVSAEHAQLSKILKKAMMQMPEKYERVIRMHYGFDGSDPKNYSEIAREFSVSVSTAKAMVYRSLMQLQQNLKQVFPEKYDSFKNWFSGSNNRTNSDDLL